MAYKARDRDDLIAGVDEFLDEVIVLPPGEWDPKIRIEPPKKVPSAEMRSAGVGYVDAPSSASTYLYYSLCPDTHSDLQTSSFVSLTYFD